MILKIIIVITLMLAAFELGWAKGRIDLCKKNLNDLCKWRKLNYPTWEERHDDIHHQ